MYVYVYIIKRDCDNIFCKNTQSNYLYQSANQQIGNLYNDYKLADMVFESKRLY